jgi:acylglycerol lipase
MKEFYLVNRNNIKINVLEGIHISNSHAIIVHVHGLGSHFQPVFESLDEFKNRDIFFSNFNYKSFALEFHGHGKSDGSRCSINSIDDLVDDLDTLVRFLEILYNKPIFLFAESMGCSVALKYCITINKKIKGLIFIAPLFGIDQNLKPNFFITSILKLISYCFPELSVSASSKKLSLESTNNKCFLEAKEKNYYSYCGSHKLNTCRELLNISNWIEQNGYLLETPILIFHGLKDSITVPKLTEQIFNKMKHSNKELHLLEEGYHCLLIESEENPYLPGYILSKMVKWINDNF